MNYSQLPLSWHWVFRLGRRTKYFVWKEEENCTPRLPKIDFVRDFMPGSVRD
jgi:hypothetical protein